MQTRRPRRFLRRRGRRRYISIPAQAGVAAPRAAVASVPPKPIVSTADEGTMTMEPRSLMASPLHNRSRSSGRALV